MIFSGWMGNEIPGVLIIRGERENWRLAPSPLLDLIEENAHAAIGKVLRENLTNVREIIEYEGRIDESNFRFNRGYMTSEGEIASPELKIFNSSTVIAGLHESDPEVIAGFSWVSGAVPTLLHPGNIAKPIGIEIHPYRIGWVEHFCTLMAEEFNFFATVKTIVR